MSQQTISVKVADVKPGTILWAHGHAWAVRTNTFDPIGSGNKAHPIPRRILGCEAAFQHQHDKLGAFAVSLTMGFYAGASVDIIPTAADLCAAIENHVREAARNDG